MINSITPQRKNGGLGVMVCCSAFIHLAVFILLLNFHFPAHFKEAPVYYVDVLDLPVASPQAGTPGGAQRLPAPPQPAPPPPPLAPKPREMTLPAKPPEKAPAGPTALPPKKQPDKAETAREFEERMARLEREDAARHQAAALAALKKSGSKGTAGMPGAAGSEAGSDYASYIKSRLEDEFKATITFQTKNPEVLVKLIIGQNGRVIRQQIIKSSQDKLFEDSVFRTIIKAEKNFRPPPSGNQFEIEIRFSPQGIGKQ